MSKGWKRAAIWTGCSFTVVIMAIGGYAWYMLNKVEDTVAAMYEEIAPERTLYVSQDNGLVLRTERDKEQILETSPLSQETNSTLRQEGAFTVLVMGVDEREHDRGRSDAMIVLAVNPAKPSVLMFNIPRDTRTELIGKGRIDKINHAYAFGGVEMSLRTVEHFLDYPIDYYVKVNMEGFANMIDIIGGIEVNNAFAFQHDGNVFERGPISLNGAKALSYARMRYDDPRGDLGRNTRQREILGKIFGKLLSISTLGQANELLENAGQYVRMNITFNEIKKFVLEYRTNVTSLKVEEISGQGQMINRVWYFNVNQQERDRIHALLRGHMEP
ncbi:hypothetical protein EBB07_14140 [Paenibacillaceae bacterium]|nr:hypothetical protein EBB07_14140 [Paenibacillaceae bacterium]